MVARAKVTIGIATRKVTGIATNIMASPYQTPVASVTGAAIVELGWDHELLRQGRDFVNLLSAYSSIGARAPSHMVSFCVTVFRRWRNAPTLTRAAANKTANLPRPPAA